MTGACYSRVVKQETFFSSTLECDVHIKVREFSLENKRSVIAKVWTEDGETLYLGSDYAFACSVFYELSSAEAAFYMILRAKTGSLFGKNV